MVVLFAMGAAQAAAAEVPDSIKNRISLWAAGNGSSGEFAQAIVELSERGIIKEKVLQNVHMPPNYGQTAFVKIVGRSTDYGQTSPIQLTVTDPDGIRTKYTVPILESGAYTTLIPLRHDAKLGMYHITAYHGGKKLPDSEFFVGYPSARIPEWISRPALWWIGGKVTDSEFFSNIEFLLKARIIEFAGSVDSVTLNVMVDGLKAVRRGTVQEINVLVTDRQGPTDGATIFVRVEDYGETVFEEFRGLTDQNGRYKISWEISSEFPNLKTFLVYVDATDGISSGSKVFAFQIYCLCGEPNCKCRR